MPNVSRPRGLVPIRRVTGEPYEGEHVIAYIPASDGTATFIGDVVIHNGSSGAAGLTIAGMDMEGVPQVIRFSSGTAGQNYFGVVVGFYPDPTSLTTAHRAASTNRVAMIALAQDYVFEVQEDALVTPVAAASIGLNAALTTTAGSATTGLSGVQLDSDTVNTTATLPLKVLGLSKRVDNAFNTGGAGTDNAKFEVMFNVGVFKPNIVGL